VMLPRSDASESLWQQFPRMIKTSRAHKVFNQMGWQG
jgi:hypothetical protein